MRHRHGAGNLSYSAQMNLFRVFDLDLGPNNGNGAQDQVGDQIYVHTATLILTVSFPACLAPFKRSRLFSQAGRIRNSSQILVVILHFVLHILYFIFLFSTRYMYTSFFVFPPFLFCQS